MANHKEILLKKVKGVCLDIDDTLSTSGKLTAEAYAALWKLKAAGFAVIPITGRPAGWCDHIARFWPVDAVIGENGAFAFFMQDGIRKRIDTLGDSPAALGLTQKLKALSEKIQRQFPQARWASDQSYREYDLAIDICEDVKPWSEEDVQALLALCKKEGAHAKLSSIHVNTWFGDYDKATGFRYWLNQGAPGLSSNRTWGSVPSHAEEKISEEWSTRIKGQDGPTAGRVGHGWPSIPMKFFPQHDWSQSLPSWDEWIFIGDSPNDEPMFQAFALSVGVANLKRYLPQLSHPPTWIATHESGAGFSEWAEILIQARSL